MSTYFIAELGQNHNGSPERAAALIRQAADCKFDAVKLQLFNPVQMFREHSAAVSGLPASKEIIDVTLSEGHRLGLQVGTTVCDESVLEDARRFDFLKIGSYEILMLDLIRQSAECTRWLIISTGGATHQEVKNALHSALHVDRITLLHCVSIYPCLTWGAQLNRIDELRSGLHKKLMFGYSDHTCDVSVVRSAVIDHGAQVIEMHLDLDDRAGMETNHSWWPSAAKQVIEDIQGWESAVERERSWRRDPKDGRRPML